MSTHFFPESKLFLIHLTGDLFWNKVERSTRNIFCNCCSDIRFYLAGRQRTFGSVVARIKQNCKS